MTTEKSLGNNSKPNNKN